MRLSRRGCLGLLAGGVIALAQAQPGLPGHGTCTPAGRCSLVAEAGWLLLLDGAATIARWPLQDAQGRAGGLLAAFEAPTRRSFIVVLQGLSELWEISTDPDAAPIYDGLVHDWRLGEGIARPGYLGLRRIRLARPWTAAFFDARMPWLAGAESGESDGAATEAVVLHLDIRRAVLRLPLDRQRATPLQGAALVFSDDGRPVHLRLPAPAGLWQWVDVQRWVLLPGEGAVPD
jgi:hypothetical protein